MAKPIQRDWAALLVSLGFVLGATILAASNETLKRYFDYSKKPSTGIIEVVVAPSSTLDVTTYSIYGDGRLSIVQKSTAPDAKVLYSTEVMLGQDVLESILEDAVDSGLITFDPKKREDELVRSGRRMPRVTDATAILFKISLEHYAEGSAPAIGPISSQFSVSSPDLKAERFPDERAYQSLARLTKLLARAHERAVVLRDPK